MDPGGEPVATLKAFDETGLSSVYGIHIQLITGDFVPVEDYMDILSQQLAFQCDEIVRPSDILFRDIHAQRACFWQYGYLFGCLDHIASVSSTTASGAAVLGRLKFQHGGMCHLLSPPLSTLEIGLLIWMSVCARVAVHWQALWQPQTLPGYDDESVPSVYLPTGYTSPEPDPSCVGAGAQVLDDSVQPRADLPLTNEGDPGPLPQSPTIGLSSYSELSAHVEAMKSASHPPVTGSQVVDGTTSAPAPTTRRKAGRPRKDAKAKTAGGQPSKRRPREKNKIACYSCRVLKVNCGRPQADGAQNTPCDQCLKRNLYCWSR
ncbi:hypothetical protein CC2G_014503 [Coprinopsis cinerea AmutBmut pab1-1]|nr:hypothetical protein CC2G_014503 [Coprinopsis cinerea AmutBmut pab1-1]